MDQLISYYMTGGILEVIKVLFFIGWCAFWVHFVISAVFRRHKE